jgi:hypothetical protein
LGSLLASPNDWSSGEDRHAVSLEGERHVQHVGCAGRLVEIAVGRIVGARAHRGIQDGVVGRRIEWPTIDPDLTSGFEAVLPLPELNHPPLALRLEEDRFAVDDRVDQQRAGVERIGVAKGPLQSVHARIDDVLSRVVEEAGEVHSVRQRTTRRPV